MSKTKRRLFWGFGILHLGLVWISIQIGIEIPSIFGSLMIGLILAGIGIIITALAISNR